MQYKAQYIKMFRYLLLLAFRSLPCPMQLANKLFMLVFLIVLPACSPEMAAIKGCEAQGEILPICLFNNPEDIIALNQQYLIISEMGGMEGDKPGKISLYDTVNQQVKLLYEGALYQDAQPQVVDQTVTQTVAQMVKRGSNHCPGEPNKRFSPHGIDLVQHNDGSLELLVINHGEREAVELFEINIKNGLEPSNDPDNVSLTWRGCVPVPDDQSMNDVAALNDGGFIATHMFDKHQPKIFGLNTGMWLSMFGVATSYLLEWHPGDENMQKLTAVKGAFFNGLVVSADNKFIFVNVFNDNEVLKIDRASGKVIAKAEVTKPDNSSWDEQHNLLVASNTASTLDLAACLDEKYKICPTQFSVVKINPATMMAETILRQKGEPIGAGTVATGLGEYLYVGSYQSDRIARFPYPKK